jgi:uncharacterized protein
MATLLDTTFTSDGIELAGHLRLPAARPPTGVPAVVLTGPFTGVKEQVVGTYAEALADAGYATLAFDHRNFGASGGAPRQHEDAAGKLADLRGAVSHLAHREEVDAERIAVLGICLGTAYALRFSAFDPRVRALALVAGAYNDPREMRTGMTPQGYRSMLARLAEVAQREHVTGEIVYMAAVSDDDTPAAMGGQEPFDYYGTDRAPSPGWRNQVTELSLRELITLDAAMGAEFISPTPTLIVHGRRDDYCSPEAAAAVHARMGEPKRIVWLDTSNHIDLYDNPAFVEPAVAEVTAWFDTHLGALDPAEVEYPASPRV